MKKHQNITLFRLTLVLLALAFIFSIIVGCTNISNDNQSSDGSAFSDFSALSTDADGVDLTETRDGQHTGTFDDPADSTPSGETGTDTSSAAGNETNRDTTSITTTVTPGVSDTVAAPVTDTTTDPLTESISDPISESLTDPVDDDVTDSDSIPDSVTDSVTLPVTSTPITSTPVTSPSETIPSVTESIPAQTTTSAPPSTTEDNIPETEPHSHTYGTWITVKAASCTSGGKRQKVCACGDIISENIKATGHTEVIDKAVPPTATQTGLTQGSHCSVCGTVIIAQEIISAVDYTDPRLYESNYGYDYLGTLPNGKAMKKLYDAFETDCYAFHSNSSLNAGNDCIVSSVNITELGLTVNEAYSVWAVFKNDHPLFYWISSSVSWMKRTSSSSEVYFVRLSVSESYVSGASRESTNQKIYATVAELQSLYSNELTNYMTALAFHDAICLSMEYAYKSDGVTPETASWAHTIEGFFLYNKGVCETYTKTFQLFMNLNNVECTIVSNSSHSWNIIRLDDGNWYWCDVTWDDAPNWDEGVVHLYFCVNDTERIWEGYISNSTDTFFTNPSHQLNTSNDYGVNFSAGIPDRSKTPYTSNLHPIAVENFTVGTTIYRVAGYSMVSVNSYYFGTQFPNTVEYKGRTYTVVKP